MSMIPLVGSVEEIPAAVEYAESRPYSRWYITKRAVALGRADLVPRTWGEPMVAAALAGQADDTAGPGYQGQLANITQLSNDELVQLAADVTDAFEAADEADDLDAMNAAADAIQAVKAEADRRGLDLNAEPAEPVTAASTAAVMDRPPVPADRQPLGVNRPAATNTVVAAGGVAPAWSSMIPVDPFAGTNRGRSAEDTARLIAEATAADKRMRDEADAAADAAAHVDPAVITWAPFTLLRDAAEQHPHAPAWAVSVWLNAMLGPDCRIAPLDHEHVYVAHLARGYWRLSNALVRDLTADRPNPTPRPDLAVRATWRSPVASWVAPGDEGLLAALLELQPRPDPSARTADNKLRGDSPVAQLAALILGPTRGERGLSNDPRLAAYGPQSRMAAFAAELRGGAPEPVDTSVLDSLTPEQRHALAVLATQAAT